MIRFNFPHITGNEVKYIQDAIDQGRLAGDGVYTKKCNELLRHEFEFNNSFLTTSGTDALEMAALLLNIAPGDEVIMPSYTFVSTANAFVLRGAKIVFADSLEDHPNIDHDLVEALITTKTKAIVVVHYAGVACEMEKIMSIARHYNIKVVEDAAQAIGSRFRNFFLGTIGDYGAFSFHETKNIVCGEGGLLVVNDQSEIKRAEVIREKGTNRTAFFRGEIDKYGWVDVGSSFLSSEILAAFLYAQLEKFHAIQDQRRILWDRYNQGLSGLKDLGYQLPMIPGYAIHNSHIFYLICPSLDHRTGLIEFLNDHGVRAVFHYLPLHQSRYYMHSTKNQVPCLPQADKFGDQLVRLPLFPDLPFTDQDFVIDKVLTFARHNK